VQACSAPYASTSRPELITLSFNDLRTAPLQYGLKLPTGAREGQEPGAVEEMGEDVRPQPGRGQSDRQPQRQQAQPLVNCGNR
jgi:hypothetical protein